MSDFHRVGAIDWVSYLICHYRALLLAWWDGRNYSAWTLASSRAFWVSRRRWHWVRIKTYLVDIDTASRADDETLNYAERKLQNLESLPPRDLSAYPELQELEAYVEQCRQEQLTRLARFKEQLDCGRRLYRVRCIHVVPSWWVRAFASSVYIDSQLREIIFESVDDDRMWRR